MTPHRWSASLRGAIALLNDSASAAEGQQALAVTGYPYWVGPAASGVPYVVDRRSAPRTRSTEQ